MQTKDLIHNLRIADDLPQFLVSHIASADLLYKPIAEYTDLIAALRDIMGSYFAEICPAVFQQPVIDKDWINQHRPVWEIPGFSCFTNTTSGTTADRFQYRIHTDTYHRLEIFEHYIEILREFSIVPTRVLYFVSDSCNFSDEFVSRVVTDNVVMTHGLREAVEVFCVKKNLTYVEDHFGYYDQVLALIEDEGFELILADGHSISEMVGWIKKKGYDKKICRLLSSTSTKTNLDDLNYLKENGFIANWCDHMRCWDGGVTFFSCRENTYHLIEHFAYPMAIDGKLVSQDFFSFPNPFWNYWNGDYFSLDTEYKRCACGRIYRDFNLDRGRNTIFDNLSDETAAQILSRTKGIKRMVRMANVIKVHTNRALPRCERAEIRRSLPMIHFRFIREDA